MARVATAGKAATNMTATTGETNADVQDISATNITAVITGALSSSLRIQNTSRNIRIIPLDGGRRQSILPMTSWQVPHADIAAVRKCLESPHYQAIIDLGHLKIHETEPRRLGEPDLKAPQTPEPPEELTKVPEGVTQAGFVATNTDD